MKIVLRFNDALLREYASRGSPPLLVVYFENLGNCYPEKGWTDFGSVIVGWWLRAIKQLLGGGRQQKLCFMDGPYELTVRRMPDGSIQCRDAKRAFCCQTTFEELAGTVEKTARGIVRRLQSLQVAESERASLEKGLRLLAQGAMKQLGTKDAVE